MVFFPSFLERSALCCHNVFNLANQSLNTSDGAGERHEEESTERQPEVVKQVPEPSRGNATFSSEELIELAVNYLEAKQIGQERKAA